MAFVAGLLAGGFALQGLLPTAFEAFPAGYTLSRALLAGLLVGLGTARGSGCTRLVGGWLRMVMAAGLGGLASGSGNGVACCVQGIDHARQICVGPALEHHEAV